MIRTGRCYCGAVAWMAEGEPRWQAYCHCESCRKNCAAPVAAFLGVADGAWSWTGEEPSTFTRDQVTRYFCAICGTPMAYRSTHFPDEIHFYAASLDDPALFMPTRHYHHDEALPWMTITDDLPRHKKGDET